MNRYVVYSIPRVVASITLQLLPLYIASEGSPEHLSIAFALMYLGNMISSVYTSLLDGKEVVGIVLGHVMLTVPLLLMVQGINQALIATFMASVIASLTYFSGMLHMHRYEGDQAAWKFERISRWNWLLGLILGALGVGTLGVKGTAISLAAINLALTFPLIAWTDLRPKLNKAFHEIRKDGLLPAMEEGINALSRAEERSLRSLTVKLKAHSPLFPRPTFISLGKPSKLTLKASIAFFGMGLVYSQLVGYEKSSGVSDSTIFLLSALSSLITLISYKKASGYSNLDVPILGRSLTFIMLASMAPSLHVFLIFHVVEGITWAFLIVPLYEIALKKSTRQLGFVNFVRFLFWMLGSLVSPYIVSLGYRPLFLTSAVVLLASTNVKIGEGRGLVRRLVSRASSLAPSPPPPS